jgi:hypothetical protein
VTRGCPDSHQPNPTPWGLSHIESQPMERMKRIVNRDLCEYGILPEVALSSISISILYGRELFPILSIWTAANTAGMQW